MIVSNEDCLNFADIWLLLFYILLGKFSWDIFLFGDHMEKDAGYRKTRYYQLLKARTQTLIQNHITRYQQTQEGGDTNNQSQDETPQHQ